jgi:hypothetical protein
MQKELLAADDSQIGKQLADGAKAEDVMKEQKARDFPQGREAAIIQVGGKVQIFHQNNEKVAFNHSAALQLRKLLGAILNQYTGTN